jgi:hypothetical protein
MHLTRDGQRHLTVAFAGCRGFKLRHALFKVSAAVATKVSGLGGRHRDATHNDASRSDERPPAS